MSLDLRMARIARQEVERALDAAQAVDNAPTRAELQQQITYLHEHLHHVATAIKQLDARLNVMEKEAKATGPTDHEKQHPAARRTARKESGDKHPE